MIKDPLYIQADCHSYVYLSIYEKILPLIDVLYTLILARAPIIHVHMNFQYKHCESLLGYKSNQNAVTSQL